MISARATAQTTILSLVTSRVGCYGKASGFRCLQFMSFHRSKDFGLQNCTLQQFVFFFFQAMRSTADTLKTIFISVGHRLTASLDTAILIVKMTCRHPVPEPIRQVKPSTFFIDSQLESFKNHLRIFCYFMSAVSLTCNVKIIT
ncbi:hypothetical protein WN944_000025 [Citrus x changshan-huyou]|uniref:Uncharacterized protein n=1 Tax=Citrus x changshan-huyou TaxID=2935761 RepID=A0AAP0MEJ8_9ROSI